VAASAAFPRVGVSAFSAGRAEEERALNELESRDLLCELCYAREKTVEIRPW
jgi:hypothetical protein